MNNNFMRQGQGNRNRNNRNNRNNNNNRNRSSGGGNNGGGNSGNKVFDSNGPDVKVRGTAQTVAEKYMQLGRDAQSSGDTVAAETYYQHAEHYYRLWAANQPQGASLIMSLKYGEDEVEEDGGAEGEAVEAGEVEGQPVEAVAIGQGAENGDAPPVDSQPRDDGQQRNNNRGNNRERFRPRWQRDRDRNQPQDGNSETAGNVQGAEPHQSVPAIEAAPDNGQWEAPSFLQRPTPAGAVEADAVEPPRRGRPRKERVEEAAPVEDTTSSE